MAIISDKETLKVIDAAIKRFDGNSDILGSAIGALHIGRAMGWKTLYLIHTKSTIRKYEKVLDLTFREVLDEKTSYSTKSTAFKAVQKVSNFWKAVKGEIPNIRSQRITKK
jgi:hypothetical protein